MPYFWGFPVGSIVSIHCVLQGRDVTKFFDYPSDYQIELVWQKDCALWNSGCVIKHPEILPIRSHFKFSFIQKALHDLKGDKGQSRLKWFFFIIVTIHTNILWEIPHEVAFEDAHQMWFKNGTKRAPMLLRLVTASFLSRTVAFKLFFSLKTIDSVHFYNAV